MRSSPAAPPPSPGNDDEILGQVATHAKEDHGMQEVPAEVVDAVKANIQEA